ncbi:RNA polymerase sigma factor SigI [Paenibacillus psychroresistens]|uniref:RNA polymerase sigma factor SigI n=1 Tax=Paenibacillus psychroresistens TaxID=1778678 RepID=A0A6B8RZ44_9BACL|nr:RNA polymerase sigma factor SigI [Paenibacillus psychroresistens]
MVLVLFKRFLGKDRSNQPNQTKSETPEQWVSHIQQGDLRMRNQFITDYQPYVAKVVSRFCKRYIDPAVDDEFSIGLSAFNEAISQFSTTGGSSFLGFAETVMRRRLIDHVRKEQRHNQQVPLSSFDSEDDEQNIINPVETQQAIDVYEKQAGIVERQSEIKELNQALSEYGIRFMDLVEASPSHADSREALFKIGKLLTENDEWMQVLLSKRTLPIKELLSEVQVSRKTLERNRKFIIAVALIHYGTYPFLREYLHSTNIPS